MWGIVTSTRLLKIPGPCSVPNYFGCQVLYAMSNISFVALNVLLTYILLRLGENPSGFGVGDSSLAGYFSNTNGSLEYIVIRNRAHHMYRRLSARD